MKNRRRMKIEIVCYKLISKGIIYCNKLRTSRKNILIAPIKYSEFIIYSISEILHSCNSAFFMEWFYVKTLLQWC